MEKNQKSFRRKLVENAKNYEFLTLGHFGPLPPSEAHSPDLTLACYSPGGPEKNGLCSGGIGPHLGEMWEIEIFRIDI